MNDRAFQTDGVDDVGGRRREGWERTGEDLSPVAVPVWRSLCVKPLEVPHQFQQLLCIRPVCYGTGKP